jgi:transmembrane sensor
MTSKEKKGLEQWQERHSSIDQEGKFLQRLWDATSSYKEQYQPDLNKGLNKFKARMADESSVKTKVVRLNPMAKVLRIAAAIVILLGGFYVFKLAFPAGTSTETQVAETGIQKAIMLEDGTSVTLNETSSLTFPEEFSPKERRVELKGEAFFEVAKDAAKPFIVSTELADIQVLGTSFNVRAYDDEGLLEVYVKTGKVAVTMKESGKRVELNPGEKLVFEKQFDKIVSSKDPTSNALGWKEGTLIFKEKTFREIFSEIERQFDVKIKVKNEQLLNCRYTLTIEKDKLEEDLNSISVSFPVIFKKLSPDSLEVTGTCSN